MTACRAAVAAARFVSGGCSAFQLEDSQTATSMQGPSTGIAYCFIDIVDNSVVSAVAHPASCFKGLGHAGHAWLETLSKVVLHELFWASRVNHIERHRAPMRHAEGCSSHSWVLQNVDVAVEACDPLSIFQVAYQLSPQTGRPSPKLPVTLDAQPCRSTPSQCTYPARRLEAPCSCLMQL